MPMTLLITFIFFGRMLIIKYTIHSIFYELLREFTELSKISSGGRDTLAVM